MAIAIAIACAVLTLGLAPTRAHARGGVRTVLVIDASSSMKRTDPNDLRKVAAELYVDLARRGDRIAVTGFDERARQSTNGFIAITGPDRRQRLKQAIRAIGNDGKWTDFTAGLEEARRLLEGSPQREGEESLVVFLTDGKCEPDPEGAMAEEARTRDARTELCKDRTLNQLASSLGGARVYAIGLSKGAPAPFLEELGRRTGGEGVVTLDPRILPSLFAKVYARLLGSRLEEADIQGEASFPVYEGASAIDVVIVGRTEKSGVLRDPAGAEIAIDNRDPEQVYFAATDEYRFYKIAAPRAGTWTVESTGPGKLRLATLQHFDLSLALVDTPRALELGESLTIRGRLASAGEDGTPGTGTTPPMDFLDRHTMYALIGEDKAAVKREMKRGDDGTFTVEYTPESLGSVPIGLWLEPKSGGVLTRAAPTLGRIEVIPPVYVNAQGLDFGSIKHRASGVASLDLSKSEHAVELVLALELIVPEGAPPEAVEALEYITLIPTELAVPLPEPLSSSDRKPFTAELTLEIADRAPGGRHALALAITPTEPAGFEERAITVPLVVEIVPLTFWERYQTWIVRSAIGVLVLLVLLGFILPARFKKRAILYYADIRDPEMIRRSSYPLGSRARAGFYRGARVALGPSGPVKKGGSVTLHARSGGGIEAAPGSAGGIVYRVDLSSMESGDDDESALVSDLEPDERPRVGLDKNQRFRLSSGVGYEVAGSGFVFWYK